MTSFYYRFIYRHLMRLAHRYNWHYAPIIGPMDDGKRFRWCHWCGMRSEVVEIRYTLGKAKSE